MAGLLQLRCAMPDLCLHLAEQFQLGQQLQIAGVGANMKSGGNKSVEQRLDTAARLAARGGPMDAEARERLLRRMQK